ncbi:MAG: SLBB domain-containing protein [Gemmatimonadales bacterium]
MTRRLPIHALVLLAGILLATVASVAPPPLTAQEDVPTPAEAEQLLQTRPDLVAQLQQRIGTSGLTPNQIRARLRAAGYPEDLLDPYLAGADSTFAPVPTGPVFDAVQLLGLVGVEEIESFRSMTDSALAVADSLRADSLALGRTGLQIFGLDVFRRVSTQFRPDAAGPVDDNYVLGPGDELVLFLSGDVEIAHNLAVSREGVLVIPQVGQLAIGGLTLAQLRDLLYTRLGRVYSGVRRGPDATTQFQVTVTRLRTIQVFVAGDVARPGAYTISGAGTALAALYQAGGPTENGSLRRILIRRRGRVVDSLDIYDYLLRGDTSGDARLESGDVVFVPVRGTRVTMTGSIVRPAIYELKPGESLRDVIRGAGGFEANALRSRVQIHRILPPVARGAGGPDRVVIEVVSNEFIDGDGPAFPMEPGDSVMVFAIAERQQRYVTVEGNVGMEGRIGFRPGMRLSQAISLAGGPKPDVYLGQILITRLRPDSTRIQLRSAFRDSTGAVTDDLTLQDEDVIRLFSRTTFRPERYVAVNGAVRMSGRLPFREGMTLRDAILESDGLTEDAWLESAEIARLPQDRSGGIVATTIRAPMDSTYLFDRGPDGSYLGPPGLPAPASGAADVLLRPYDNILILRQPDWELQRNVAIYGQVRFAGTYALETRAERLTDLIQRAGGLTTEAYPMGVEFHRSFNREGRIGIDLPKALEDPDFRDNLVLLSGDSIFIPEFNPVVEVRGAVNAPVAVTWVPGRDIQYYIGAAGGYTRDAERGRAYVVQPNGKVESVGRRTLVPDKLPKPQAGAQLYVPAKPKDLVDNSAALFGIAAQVLASIMTVIIVAIR